MAFQFKGIVFVVVSLGIAWLSRTSLRDFRSHGFYCFFSWARVSLAVIATFFLTVTAKMEEVENIRFFGVAYQSYMRQTKLFVPFLF